MSGAGKFNWTVWESSFTIPPSMAFFVFSSTNGPILAAIELPSTSASHQRLKLKTTSSAFNSSPFSPTELQKKLKPLKSYNLLKGYRGSSEYSLKKLCEAASKISYLALDFNEYINEIDINPIIILEDNAIAVDNVFISKN